MKVVENGQQHALTSRLTIYLAADISQMLTNASAALLTNNTPLPKVSIGQGRAGDRKILGGPRYLPPDYPGTEHTVL